MSDEPTVDDTDPTELAPESRATLSPEELSTAETELPPNVGHHEETTPARKNGSLPTLEQFITALSQAHGQTREEFAGELTRIAEDMEMLNRNVAGLITKVDHVDVEIAAVHTKQEEIVNVWRRREELLTEKVEELNKVTKDLQHSFERMSTELSVLKHRLEDEPPHNASPNGSG